MICIVGEDRGQTGRVAVLAPLCCVLCLVSCLTFRVFFGRALERLGEVRVGCLALYTPLN